MRLVISLRGLRLHKAVRISVWKPVLDHASVMLPISVALNMVV